MTKNLRRVILILGTAFQKSEVLKETGRVELRGGVVEKLIKEFCDSVYMDQENLEANLYELIEMFYEAKNETMELLTDDELIQFMRKAFDEICHGDLDYVSGWVRNRLRENLQNGKSMEECMKAWKEEYE